MSTPHPDPERAAPNRLLRFHGPAAGAFLLAATRQCHRRCAAVTTRGGAVYYAARREPATVSYRLVRAGGRRLHLYFRRFDPRPSRSARRCASVTTQPRPSPRVSARSVFGRCSSISPTLPAAPFSTCATRRSPRARRRVSAAEGHREAHLGDDITSQRDPSNDVLGCIEEVLHRLGSGHAAAGVAFIDAKTGTAQQALRQPGQHPPWRWPRRACSSPGSRSRINTASLSRSGSDPVARSPGGGTTATQPGTRRQAAVFVGWLDYGQVIWSPMPPAFSASRALAPV